MVNRGRSGACQTCKARRVKCDEARPGCLRCERAGRRCAGYAPVSAKIRFKDQSHRFSNTPIHSSKDSLASLRVSRHGQVLGGPVAVAVAVAASSVARPLSTDSQNAASLFAHLLDDAGRSSHSSRGFFDLLGPALSSQRQDSALSLVISAVAETFLDMWQEGARAFQTPRESFNRAMLRLRTATLDITERRDPATVLAVLVLQFHENLAALFTHRQATRVHHGGAEALLRLSDLEDNSKGTTHGAQIARYMASIEVSSATREGRPVPQSAINRLNSGDSAALPPTPSSTLDALGASVAGLQFSYMESSAHRKFPLSLEDVTTWWLRISELDKRLKTWADTMPPSCRPIRLHQGKDFNASIPAYQAVCDVYPSCQIAAMWNLWRCYRLIVLKMRIYLLRSHRSWFAQSLFEESEFDFTRCSEEAQEIVDSICYSVPFYLGSRAAPCTVRDFSDPNIHFPSIHCLPAGDARLQSQDHLISKNQHKYHALVQGLWHLLGPLSRLLVILSEDHLCLITGALRTGQREWIAEQFLRLNVLQRLNIKFVPNQPSGPSNSELADELAKIVQQGLSLTSGL